MVVLLKMGQLHHSIEVIDICYHLAARRPFIHLATRPRVGCVVEIDAEHAGLDASNLHIEDIVFIIVTIASHVPVSLADRFVFPAMKIDSIYAPILSGDQNSRPVDVSW